MKKIICQVGKKNKYRYKTSKKLNRKNLLDLYQTLHLDNREYTFFTVGEESYKYEDGGN